MISHFALGTRQRRGEESAADAGLGPDADDRRTDEAIALSPITALCEFIMSRISPSPRAAASMFWPFYYPSVLMPGIFSRVPMPQS